MCVCFHFDGLNSRRIFTGKSQSQLDLFGARVLLSKNWQRKIVKQNQITVALGSSLNLYANVQNAHGNCKNVVQFLCVFVMRSRAPAPELAIRSVRLFFRLFRLAVNKFVLRFSFHRARIGLFFFVGARLCSIVLLFCSCGLVVVADLIVPKQN